MNKRARKYWYKVCDNPILRGDKIEVEWRWPDGDYSECSIGYLMGCDNKGAWLSRQQNIHSDLFQIPFEQIVCIRELTYSGIYRPRTIKSKTKEAET